MTNSPLDVNTREMIGKVFFYLSVSTDPSYTIRLTSSIIALVGAALHKIGVHQYDEDLKKCRRNWKSGKQRYTNGQIGWSSCEDILSDLHDFLYDIAIENDIIIIKSEWYNLSAAPAMMPPPGQDPMDVLRSIQEA